ncbi:SDR family oxidoreductase [Rhodobacterales bacterium]|nr:SDR family oxidoreductase [Rhodobacterales bacterium]
MKTVLITGCSSGFGLETARLFLDKGWQVVATMRNPQEGILPASDNLRLLPLDVTDAESIAHAVEETGPVDALVNNAGIGLMGPLEAVPMATIREVFETNTFGTMALTQALLPMFRQQGSGTIVNVTSSVTLKTLPLLSVYSASKAAVETFSACLALELEPFGIGVKLVLPGRSATRFSENARSRMASTPPEAYAGFMQQVFAGMSGSDQPTTATDVAGAVFRAVTDPACPFRIPAGADAVEWFEEAA